MCGMSPGRQDGGYGRPACVPALLAVLLVVAPTPAAGQSPTPVTSLGLGYPTPPVDARAAALGGVGVGLLGGTFSIRNPADLVEIPGSSLSVSAAPEDITLRSPGGGEAATARSRFSTLRAVVPLGEWVVSAGFASELDQDWEFRIRDTLTTSGGDFPFDERRENDGGVSVIDVSLARSVGPVSAGVAVQRLTGSLQQVFSRRFEAPEDSVRSVRREATWSYGGWRVRAGLGVRVGDWLRVSGAYSVAGDLDAERTSTTVAVRELAAPSPTISMPASAEAGASAVPADDWLVTAGGGWTQWSEASSSLTDGRARDVFWGGGGVEYRGVQIGSFPIRLRAGGRFAELPFVLEGRAPLSESAFTAGLGTQFASGRAELDVAAEIGSRGDASRTGLEETFRRFTLTATIHQ